MNFKTSREVLSNPVGFLLWASYHALQIRSGYQVTGNRFVRLIHKSRFVNTIFSPSEALSLSGKPLNCPMHTFMRVALLYKQTITSLAGRPVPALPGYRIFSLQWWPAEWSADTYIAEKVIAATMLMQPSLNSRWTQPGAINRGCRQHKAPASC